MDVPRPRVKGAASFAAIKPVCQILVLHEDFPAYFRAVEVCRRLMERFASELEFDIKCWNFIELADPNCARHAAKSAASADILLVALHHSQTSTEFDRWLDHSFTSRQRAEGVLALVLSDVSLLPVAPEKWLVRMQLAARRLGMDFLSLPTDESQLLSVPVIPAARPPS